jgi:hypothetical protein
MFISSLNSGFYTGLLNIDNSYNCVFRSLGFLVFLVSPTMGLFTVGVMLSYVSVRFGHLR